MGYANRQRPTLYCWMRSVVPVSSVLVFTSDAKEMNVGAFHWDYRWVHVGSGVSFIY